jgi:membrane protein required for colicin V production
MTALDMIVLLLMGGAGFLGFSRGFVTETLSIGAWIAALAAVKLLHTPVAGMLTDMVGTTAGASVLAFALTFGVTMIAGKMVARSIGEKSKSSGMGLFDRVLGLGFGALKGLIGATIGFVFVTLVYDTIYGGATERPNWMLESRSYPLLNASGNALISFVNERRNGGAEAPAS